MLRHASFLAVGLLLLASLASASEDLASPAVCADPTDFLMAPANPGDPAGPVESGDGRAPGGAEYRIPINGCDAQVSCPTGGFVRCVSWYQNGCVERQDGTPPWVACDGVVKSCPGAPPE